MTAALMVDMTNFDDTRHPRGQAGNAGQFRAKTNTAPAATLPTDPHDVAAEPITTEQLMEMLADPERYAPVDVDHTPIGERSYAPVEPTPSRWVNVDRPSFTGTGEQDFRVALERIDSVWDPSATVEARSEAVIADMRRSGALGRGAGAALEAYARALTLNESGGYIDEEQVNFLLDHIEAGGTDYRTNARAFGYHPEQYVVDLAHRARAAAYRAAHAEDDVVRAAAEERRATLTMLAEDAVEKADRGWSSRERDIDRLGELSRRCERAIAGAMLPETGVILTARRRAYQDALDLIFNCGDTED